MVGELSVFTTRRLRVADWRVTAPAAGRDALVHSVLSILTPAVTQTLPPEWQGAFDRTRARAWIDERDRDGSTLLATDIAEGRPVGLIVLHEEAAVPGVVAIRLGYMVAEWAWGSGFGGEMVSGFVAWCRTRPSIASLRAGVGADNAASVRILERSGFARDTIDAGAESLDYLLDLHDG